jgi:hypothetical protein
VENCNDELIAELNASNGWSTATEIVNK